MKYPVTIHFIDEADDCNGRYFFAYCPDFGHSACSATGESALRRLAHIQQIVLKHYTDSGRPVPKPSPPPFEPGAGGNQGGV